MNNIAELPDWAIDQIIRHPELYTFVQDPSKGLFSAIIPDLPGNLLRQGRIFSPTAARNIIDEVMGVEIPKEDEEVYGHTPEELARHWTKKIAYSAAGNITAIALLSATTLASSIPFIGAGETLDEAWRIPIVSNLIRTSTETLMAKYNIVQRPLMQRHLNSIHQPLLPETYRLAIAVSKGVLDIGVYHRAMAESGLSLNWAEMWRDESYEYPALEVALALYRRGDITEEHFHRWLERSSIHENVRDKLILLKDVIPPLPDLTRMAVREAFGTHAPEEQYPEYESWAKKMGLSEYFAGAYWYAHWDRIALAQMYDNLWRGLWSEERFKAMLRIKDVHPDDRDAIYDVAFRPPSLREMGYGWDTGVYKEDDIKKYRRWGGLSPEDAELSARSMVAYRTEAEREAVRREYMHLYALDKINETTFRENLERLITAPEAVELWVERGNLERQRKSKPLEPLEYRVVSGSEAKWAFVNKLRGRDWYRAALEDLDWDEQRVQLAVERAETEITEAAEVPVEPEFRSLTIGQIGDLYRFRKVDAGELPNIFGVLGYSPEDAENLAQVMVTVREQELLPTALSRTDIARFYDIGVYSEDDLRPAFERLRYSTEDAVALALYTKINIRFPDLKAMYGKGWISSGEMFDELIDLGLAKERANELMMMVVKAEQPARVEKERDLTKSEIVKGVKGEVITPNLAVNLLMDLGYEEWEAWYILAINKVVAVGDPEGYWEMKRVTEAYKKATGKKSKEVSEDLLVWEQRVKVLRNELKNLTDRGAPEEEVGRKAIELNNAEANYRRMMQEWERSEL